MQDGGNNTLPSSASPTTVSSENPINTAAFSISTKSQAMDDVLEILIRNGGLSLLFFFFFSIYFSDIKDDGRIYFA